MGIEVEFRIFLRIARFKNYQFRKHAKLLFQVRLLYKLDYLPNLFPFLIFCIYYIEFIAINNNFSQIQMNRKQSHEPIGSYSQHSHQKNQYQPSSPYIQLLDSKKGVYGHRYDTKNVRSFTNYAKPSPASIASVFYQKPKSMKSTSTEKVKATSYTNDKRKRTRTEQADQKMHESMCVYPTISQKINEENASKSLFYQQGKINSQFQPNQYFQQLSNQKNKRKRHLSENKHGNQQGGQNLLKTANLLQNLQINDIDSLLNLIDNCVSEANQYISYLSEKLSAMKEELMTCRSDNMELQNSLQKKNLELLQKDDIIRGLDRKLSESKQYRKENGFQVKNLLQIIQKLSEENEKLRNEVDQLAIGREKKITNESREKQKQKLLSEKEKQIRRDYYNEIHSKIDILNISIDNNHNFSQNNNSPDSRNVGEKFERQISKKFKFIKPKGR